MPFVGPRGSRCRAPCHAFGHRTGQENEPRTIAIARFAQGPIGAGAPAPPGCFTIRRRASRAAPPAPRRAWARSRPAGARLGGAEGGAGLARIGRQRQRQRLDRHAAEVDAVGERLDLVVLLGVDDDLGAGGAASGRKVRRTGWSMRVVTGSRVTTQDCTTVAPRSASSCQPPLASGVRRPWKRILRSARASRRRASASASRAVGGDVEVEGVEVAELAELDHAGEFGIVGGVGGKLGHHPSSGRGARGERPKFLEFRPCAE